MPKHTRKKERRLLLRAVFACIEDIERMEKKDLPRIEEELNEAALSIITKWYASYEPEIYRRQMSLKKAFRVTVNTSNIGIDYDYKYIEDAGYTHNQKAEIIFNNSFMSGFHGGSYGVGIPSSTLYWRSPVPYYSEWGHPSIKTFSPYREIEEDAENIVRKEAKNINDRLKKHETTILRHFEKYTRR